MKDSLNWNLIKVGIQSSSAAKNTVFATMEMGNKASPMNKCTCERKCIWPYCQLSLVGRTSKFSCVLEERVVWGSR